LAVLALPEIFSTLVVIVKMRGFLIKPLFLGCRVVCEELKGFCSITCTQLNKPHGVQLYLLEEQDSAFVEYHESVYGLFI